MTKKVLLSFATLALAVASAASSHKLVLFRDAEVNGKLLKAGEYKLEVKDGTAVIKGSKETVEAPIKVETADSKFSSTSVRFDTGSSNATVQEIRIGGTNTKLVFSDKS